MASDNTNVLYFRPTFCCTASLHIHYSRANATTCGIWRQSNVVGGGSRIGLHYWLQLRQPPDFPLPEVVEQVGSSVSPGHLVLFFIHFCAVVTYNFPGIG